MSKNKDVEELQKKTQDLADKMQKWGCALTVLITIPLLLTAFLGPFGLVISGVIVILYLFGRKKE